MRLIDYKAKDVYCLFEINLSDLRKLKNALDRATLELDLTKTEEKEIHEYIHEELYPEIVKTIKGVDPDGS